MTSRGTSWMAFGFVSLLIYLNYRSKVSHDEFGRDRTRHLIPLSKRVDKDAILKEIGDIQASAPASSGTTEEEATLAALAEIINEQAPEKKR